MRFLMGLSVFLMAVVAPTSFGFFLFDMYTGVQDIDWTTAGFVTCIVALVGGGMLRLWASPMWKQPEEIEPEGRHAWDGVSEKRW